MGGKERVTRSFFAKEGLERADALAPQLQSVWVALYQGNVDMLLSGSIGFTFAGEGPMPKRSDLVVGSVERAVELADNKLFYVLDWPKENAGNQSVRTDDWLLFGAGSISNCMAEEYKGLKARHYRWFEEASYEAEKRYFAAPVYGAEGRRDKADMAWQATVGVSVDENENENET
jgi:hypothetical protein